MRDTVRTAGLVVLVVVVGGFAVVWQLVEDACRELSEARRILESREWMMTE